MHECAGCPIGTGSKALTYIVITKNKIHSNCLSMKIFPSLHFVSAVSATFRGRGLLIKVLFW